MKPPQNSLAVTESKKAEIVVVEYLQRFANIEGRNRELELLYPVYTEIILNHKPPFSLRQIEKGLRTALETQKVWPWPADLIEYIEEEI